MNHNGKITIRFYHQPARGSFRTYFCIVVCFNKCFCLLKNNQLTTINPWAFSKSRKKVLNANLFTVASKLCTFPPRFSHSMQHASLLRYSLATVTPVSTENWNFTFKSGNSGSLFLAFGLRSFWSRVCARFRPEKKDIYSIWGLFSGQTNRPFFPIPLFPPHLLPTREPPVVQIPEPLLPDCRGQGPRQCFQAWSVSLSAVFFSSPHCSC